jgi:hypothetical protein
MGQGITHRRVRNLLAQAGYAKQHSYYLQPYPTAIESVIPVWSRAAVAHERVQHVRSGLGALRPLVAAVGLHGLLYPGAAVVGYP